MPRYIPSNTRNTLLTIHLFLPVPHTKILVAILMTSNLSWSEHIALITSKAYKKLGLLRRTFCSRNTSCVKRILYLSLVRSNLLFGSQVWRPSLLKDIKALENIQRRATKFILNGYSSSYRTRLISLHLLPLMMTLELNDISFFIKCLKQPCKSFDIMSQEYH